MDRGKSSRDLFALEESKASQGENLAEPGGRRDTLPIGILASLLSVSPPRMRSRHSLEPPLAARGKQASISASNALTGALFLLMATPEG